MKNKIIAYVFQLIAAGMLFNPAVGKLTGNEMAVGLFLHIGMEPHGRIIIGALELLAVVLLIIPQSGIYGAFLGLGVMTGAIIGHLTIIGLDGIPNALLVFACCVITIYVRRRESSIFKNMFN